MTRTLVTYASRMGGTEGIARAIADEMQRAGIDVDLRPAADVRSVTGYDAVVLGSAVYAGRWLRPARTLLKRLVASRPPADPPRVWLFHSGPLGTDRATDAVPDPARVAAAASALGADQPTTFGGRLEPATANGFLAGRMAKSDMAGDYRDFDRIIAWAAAIAAHLRGSTAGASS